MEAEELLSQLADIHLPAEPGLWPPAPGWWLLAALLMLALVLFGRRQVRLLLLKRRLRSALQELERVYQSWQQAGSGSDQGNAAGLALLYGFNAVLKRVALVTCDPGTVPRLTGRDWLRFLDEAGQCSGFVDGPGQVLADGTYRPVFNADVDALHQLCRRWITQRYLQKQAARPRVTAVSEAAA